LCSYFLHTVSHPDRYGAPIIDLSLDEEAKSVSMSSFTASEAQVKLERVIVKVDKIRAAFKAKLWRMGKCLSKNVCQEGMEKLNNITTKHYQRGTNHKDQDALRQVLEKRNRTEDLGDSGFARKKRKVVCGVCGEVGHNRRSCKHCRNTDIA